MSQIERIIFVHIDSFSAFQRCSFPCPGWEAAGTVVCAGPANRICQYLLYLFLQVNRVGLMPSLEVENSTQASGPAAAASEQFASR